MRTIATLILITIFFSCADNNSPRNENKSLENYTIIKENKNPSLRKTNIEIRIEKEISENDLEQIAKSLKKERKEYDNLWIFYYLPDNEIGEGAWATTHFSPDLEVIILGATEDASKEMEERKVTGEIIGAWKDNDAMMPSKIYLVKENGKLYIKTVRAKSKYSEAVELVEEVRKSGKNGKVRYDYDNKHGEYYLIEKNGNLGLYDELGKFKEAIKLN